MGRGTDVEDSKRDGRPPYGEPAVDIGRASLNGTPRRFEQKPVPPLGLVNPVLE